VAASLFVTPLFAVEREAIAVICILARLGARLEGGDSIPSNPDLAFVIVANPVESSFVRFATLRPVDVIASWASATLRLMLRVLHAYAFFVAAAVVDLARVDAIVFRARVLASAVQPSLVAVASWAILALEGSIRVGAFAFVVAAAVVIRALVDVFAALRSVIHIPSCAILAFTGSHRVGACAFAVAAAVVAIALVDVFAAMLSVVGIPSWASFTLEGSIRVGAFAFVVTAAVV